MWTLVSLRSAAVLASTRCTVALATALRHSRRRFSTGFGVVFDIDGVIVQGRHVLPEAKLAVRRLRERPNAHFLFLTNGGGVSERKKSEQLSAWLGVDIGPHHVVLSHSPMADLAQQHRDDLVLLLGPSSVGSVAEEYGFRKAITTYQYLALHRSLYPLATLAPVPDPPAHVDPTDPVRAVLIMNDPRDWAVDAQILCDVMRSGGRPFDPQAWRAPQPVPIYNSNMDLVWRHEFHQPRFGQGAFMVAAEALYKELTGRPLPYIRYGKPYPSTYRFARQALERQAHRAGQRGLHRIYAIGDNPAADVAGANAAGWTSVLVRTGVFAGGENDPVHPARQVCAHVDEAVQWVLSQEP